jgi:hypothetical protein
MIARYQNSDMMSVSILTRSPFLSSAVDELQEHRVDELSQIFKLSILAIPVAWIAWTVTKEEVFREFRDYCSARCEPHRPIVSRKFYYLLTCEYCLSHWVALGCQFVFGFKMIFEDWRGYFVAYAALVWTANIYMSLYQRTRVSIRKTRAESTRTERDIEQSQAA